jgi:hypothetical protein
MGVPSAAFRMASACSKVRDFDGRPGLPSGISYRSTTFRRTLSRFCALAIARRRMECRSRSERVDRIFAFSASHLSTSSADNSRGFDSRHPLQARSLRSRDGGQLRVQGGPYRQRGCCLLWSRSCWIRAMAAARRSVAGGTSGSGSWFTFSGSPMGRKPSSPRAYRWANSTPFGLPSS